MADSINTFISLASTIYNDTSIEGNLDAENLASLMHRDPVVQEALNWCLVAANRQPEIADAAPLIFSEPEFSLIWHNDEDRFPWFSHPWGGMQIAPEQILGGILSSAYFQMYFLRLANEEQTFIDVALDGFEQLKQI